MNTSAAHIVQIAMHRKHERASAFARMLLSAKIENNKIATREAHAVTVKHCKSQRKKINSTEGERKKRIHIPFCVCCIEVFI